jgi:hypothetical protein
MAITADKITELPTRRTKEGIFFSTKSREIHAAIKQ